MKTMKMMQSGFTLIELVVVIVVLGILAAVAIPKFVDLSGSATANSDKFNAASLLEQADADFAKCAATNPTPSASKPVGCR